MLLRHAAAAIVVCDVTRLATLDAVKESIVYYNGGGYFENAANYDKVSVVGYYQNHLPAIIYIVNAI